MLYNNFSKRIDDSTTHPNSSRVKRASTVYLIIPAFSAVLCTNQTLKSPITNRKTGRVISSPLPIGFQEVTDWGILQNPLPGWKKSHHLTSQSVFKNQSISESPLTHYPEDSVVCATKETAGSGRRSRWWVPCGLHKACDVVVAGGGGRDGRKKVHPPPCVEDLDSRPVLLQLQSAFPDHILQPGRELKFTLLIFNLWLLIGRLINW